MDKYGHIFKNVVPKFSAKKQVIFCGLVYLNVNISQNMTLNVRVTNESRVGDGECNNTGTPRFEPITS